MRQFIKNNSLSLVFLILFLFSLLGEIITGWKENNKEREEKGSPPLALNQYFSSGHFLQSTFENWESEFLQMTLYVLLTVSLRQLGSSESKKMEGKEEVDREPKVHSKAPWPVKKGGIWLSIYKNSLSIAFALLFLVSFALHFYGSLKGHNEEQSDKGLPPDSWNAYIASPRFWFESFQNWQSEFLAVASIVLLSIWLRQKGSPESKPVDASYNETGG